MYTLNPHIDIYLPLSCKYKAKSYMIFTSCEVPRIGKLMPIDLRTQVREILMSPPKCENTQRIISAAKIHKSVCRMHVKFPFCTIIKS